MTQTLSDTESRFIGHGRFKSLAGAKCSEVEERRERGHKLASVAER